jgi:hypothetical protein
VRKLLPLVFLAILLAQAFSQPTIPRHVNPEQLKPPIPDPAILTAIYEELSKAFLAENFSGVNTVALSLLNLSAPSDVKFILDRFHGLVQQEGVLLNYSRTSLEIAKQLALQGNITEALAYLENASLYLARANITYLSLADAARTIKGRLNAEPSSLTLSLTKLIATYFQRLSETGQLLKANLTGTNLTLSITPTTAWVGSSVHAYGYLLTDKGEPLSFKNIILTLDGKQAAEATTNEEGYYSSELQVPYTYVEKIYAYAIYLPTGNDTYNYKPTTSPNVTLHLLFTRPSINLSIYPNVALPGDEIKLNVSIDAPITTLDIYAFGECFQANTINGSASLAISIPVNVTEGTYMVIASSPANGTIAPASASATVTVRKLTLIIPQLQVPTLLPPLPSTINACLSFEKEPIPYTVEVSIPSASVYASKTSTDTCVQIEITPGILTPTGTLEGTITIQPLDPRYKPAQAKFQASSFNILLALLALALVLATLSVYMKTARRKQIVEEKPAVKPAQPVPAPEQPQVEVVEIPQELVEAGDPVVREYFKAVKLVESATGIKMKPSHTISEYLYEASSHLGRAAEMFKEISRLAEDRIYGDMEVNVDQLKALVMMLERALGQKL